MSLLDVTDLRVSFETNDGVVNAVNGITLSLERGHTLGIVGESGSGKSQFAFALMGLLAKNGRATGSARFDGQEILNAPPHVINPIRAARIAMVFQDPMTSLNPYMRVSDQMAEVLVHHKGLSKADAVAESVRMLDAVRIPDARGRVRLYPHEFSGGMRQRVMIAMALICEPDLLIADEPTTALDVTVQAEILKLMRELQQRRGMGMLFITHDFGVVSRIADTVGVMKQGRLVECGPVEQVLREPTHEYTRSLIAALPERLPRPPRGGADVPKGHEASGAAGALVEVQALSVHFPIRKGVLRRVVDQVRAVDRVSLSVRPGEVLALVGESGCGKTTLGRALLRLQATSAGRILLEGQDITHLTRRAMQPLRRRMQVVFQDPGSSLNPRLPIATTLVEPMRVHGIGRDDDERRTRAAALLERVGMPTDSLWRYPHEFSGGQRQRLAIARALVLEPSFILCDEITSALDVSVQAGILRLLRRLVDEDGLGMLFITHNMGVVSYLADRMAVMHAGRVVETGPTDQVLATPTHDYTRTLLAAVPRLDG